MDNARLQTWSSRLTWIWLLPYLLWKISAWLIEDEFRMVQTAAFWGYVAAAIAGTALLGLALIGIGLAVWKFSIWFDAALERERAKIARRSAIYHGEPVPSAAHAMHDAELDG